MHRGTGARVPCSRAIASVDFHLEWVPARGIARQYPTEADSGHVAVSSCCSHGCRGLLRGLDAVPVPGCALRIRWHYRAHLRLRVWRVPFHLRCAQCVCQSRVEAMVCTGTQVL